MHAVAAKAVALKEAQSTAYQTYARQVVANARALAEGLAEEGLRPVAGGTDTHLALLDLREVGVTGKDAEARCDAAGITLNKNAIPFDPEPPAVASGLRVGTPAVTTQGMNEVEMKEVSGLIGRAVRDADGSAAGEIREAVSTLFRRLAVGIGAMAEVRDRDVHAIPTPRLGGVAMYAGIAGALLVAARLPKLNSTFRDTSEVRAVLLAGGLVCLLGVIDDRFNLDALTKLAGQILAAGVLVLEGVQLLWIPLPSGTVVLDQQLGAIATVVVVVIIINAVNFIDGLDGLASGVVGIAAIALFAYSYSLAVTKGIDRANPPTLITAVLIGACVGFLPHNFNPARIFMGDSGSMVLGLLLSASVISLTGQLDPGAVQSLELFPTALPLLLPLLVLLVPVLDFVLAVVRRSVRGTSPFAPDKNHLHHRLLEIGHSQTRAVLLMYFWAALIAFSVVSVSLAHGPLLLVGLAVGVGMLVVLVSSVPRLRGARRATHGD
jgi:UDP-GlcNAc:undecaprenyl-phosphate GlcNAc-1-phosphate transferase